MALRNVLIDRDGTIIVEKHYLHEPSEVALIPGAAEALARLKRAGIRLFVVTNQSGIGRGYYSEGDFLAVQERLSGLLAPYGVEFDGVAFCPHAPDECCPCRKPETGMWRELRARYGLSPSETAMIGDNASDVAFGLACGLAESILVLTGHGERFARQFGLPELAGEWMRFDSPAEGRPTLLARDMAAAARFILDAARGKP